MKLIDLIKFGMADGFYFIERDGKPVIAVDWYDGEFNIYYDRDDFDEWSHELDFESWEDLRENLMQTVHWIFDDNDTKVGYFVA